MAALSMNEYRELKGSALGTFSCISSHGLPMTAMMYPFEETYLTSAEHGRALMPSLMEAIAAA